MPMNGNTKKLMEKTTLLEDIPSDVYFCSISHMTHSLYDSTDNYDSTHPNLEHDSHSTHMLSVILYPHLSYSSHDESRHTSFSHMFQHFLLSLNISFMAELHSHQCCVSSLL